MAKKTSKTTTKDEYGLTRRERIYADTLLLTGNKKKSAMKAGCTESSAPVTAARMSKNVNVITYLAKRGGELTKKLDDDYSLTSERILRELAACALFDPAKMYDDNGELLAVNKMDEMTRRAIAGVDVKEMIDNESDTITGYSKKVRTVSKIAALELAGRNLAMWGQKDSGALSILNINIITDKNQLDHPNAGKVIENGQA